MRNASISRELQTCATVADLIAELEGMPQDAVVLFVCDYGDHSHTQQALPVASVSELLETEKLTESAYSHSGLAVETADEDDDEQGYEGFTPGAAGPADHDNSTKAVILRMTQSW